MSESLKNILKNILLKQDLVELQGLSNSSKALVLSLFLNKEISLDKLMNNLLSFLLLQD